jgi:hypothetical protein
MCSKLGNISVGKKHTVLQMSSSLVVAEKLKAISKINTKAQRLFQACLKLQILYWL